MKEEMKINKEKENPSYSVSDSGSWTLGSNRYQEQGRIGGFFEQITGGRTRPSIFRSDPSAERCIEADRGRYHPTGIRPISREKY